MDVTAIALSGLGAAQKKLETASRRVAPPGQSGDLVDLSADMVALLAAKNELAANARVIRTADEMRKQTLDLLG